MPSTEFGQAVRRWRDHVPPEAAGLPTTGRRRASGLRREELALLAGISVDYLTRLEQGRATNPSSQVVEALARALRLAAPEQAHLFQLAGLASPDPTTVPTFITPSVHRLLDRLAETPVAVFDAAWNLLLANQPYAALMGDHTAWQGNERNAIWRNFHGLSDRARYTRQARSAFEASLVADLRATAARYPQDRGLKRLIGQLRAASPKFAGLWDDGAVGRHEAARKVIEHPQVGPITLDCDVLAVGGSDLRVMVFTAEPGTDDAEKLALATVLGTQTIAG